MNDSSSRTEPAGRPGNVILLGLNELNFEAIEWYARRGEMPNLAQLIQRHGYASTTSESSYQELEPWIQWVTIHTGLPLAQHGVFRLGDITGSGTRQIWEHVEDKYGLKVGAISPMNAANRARSPAFFLPDPWTPTPATASRLVRWIHSAVAVAVNENATNKESVRLYLPMLAGALRYSAVASAIDTLKYWWLSRSHKYGKAIILDNLLADIFLSLWRDHRPGFSSLFLNGAAHIQHHYMFSSASFQGAQSNPDWYTPGNRDPLRDVYRAL